MKQNSSQKRKTKGFTLVELIVVIAILAILSAVGAVAYTGYIEHTKKGLDKNLVGEIKHAMSIGAAYDASLLDAVDEEGNPVPVGQINLYPDKAAIVIEGLEGKNFVDTALKDAFGENYADSLKLSWDKWQNGNGSSYFGSNFGKIGNADLLKGVNSCVTQMASFLAGVDVRDEHINLYYGDGAVEDFNELATELGYGSKDDILKNGTALANATVLFTAQASNDNPDFVKKVFGERDYILLNKRFNASDGASEINAIAYVYAAQYALVSYLDDPDITADFTKEIDARELLSNFIGSGDGSDAEAFSSKLIKEKISSDSVLRQRYNEYYTKEVSNGKTQAQIDADSFLGIMNEVVKQQDFVMNKEDMTNPETFGPSGKVLEKMNEYTDSMNGIAITVYSNGNCKADPIDDESWTPGKMPEGFNGTVISCPFEEEHTGSCTYTVQSRAISGRVTVKFNDSKIVLCNIEKEYNTCHLTPSGAIPEGIEVTFEIISGNEVASVSSDGTITALSSGSAVLKITAKSSTASGSQEITVRVH